MSIHRHESVFKLSEYGESVTGIGLVWTVLHVIGPCGCGQIEAKRTVAYFTDPIEAMQYVEFKNAFVNAMRETIERRFEKDENSAGL